MADAIAASVRGRRVNGQVIQRWHAEPLEIVVTARSDETTTDDLTRFIVNAPSDCILSKYCAVEPEHTAEYPRPKIRFDGMRRGEPRHWKAAWRIEFLVPEETSHGRLALSLSALFAKNGFDAVSWTVGMS